MWFTQKSLDIVSEAEVRQADKNLVRIITTFPQEWEGFLITNPLTDQITRGPRYVVDGKMHSTLVKRVKDELGRRDALGKDLYMPRFRPWNLNNVYPPPPQRPDHSKPDSDFLERPMFSWEVPVQVQPMPEPRQTPPMPATAPARPDSEDRFTPFTEDRPKPAGPPNTNCSGMEKPMPSGGFSEEAKEAQVECTCKFCRKRYG